MQYAFDDPAVVSAMLDDWNTLGLDIFFLETPLRMDQVAEMGTLHAMVQASAAKSKVGPICVHYHHHATV